MPAELHYDFLATEADLCETLLNTSAVAASSGNLERSARALQEAEDALAIIIRVVTPRLLTNAELADIVRRARELSNQIDARRGLPINVS